MKILILVLAFSSVAFAAPAPQKHHHHSPGPKGPPRSPHASRETGSSESIRESPNVYVINTGTNERSSSGYGGMYESRGQSVGENYILPSGQSSGGLTIKLDSSSQSVGTLAGGYTPNKQYMGELSGKSVGTFTRGFIPSEQYLGGLSGKSVGTLSGGYIPSGQSYGGLSVVRISQNEQSVGEIPRSYIPVSAQPSGRLTVKFSPNVQSVSSLSSAGYY